MSNETKPLLGKIVIQGIMRCETGLHIGASQDSLEIGRTDSLVQRNPLTKEPYIPGSSLKGKVRSLLERIKQKDDPGKYKFNRESRVGGNTIRRHECDGKGASTFNNPAECKVCRLFGSTGDKGGENFPARLIVRDLCFTASTLEELGEIETDLLYTERKWENTLDRVTAAANPRQIERVPAGSEFFFEMVYAVEKEEDVEDDKQNILNTLSALELDALGGHGSRGYGKVKFWLDGEPRRLEPDGRDYKSFDKLKELKTDACKPLSDFFAQAQPAEMSAQADQNQEAICQSGL